MIKLTVCHHKVFIDASSSELVSFKKYLKIYSPLFNPPPGHPPFELINLFYKEDKSFPTGYLGEVEKKLKKNAVSYEVFDTRRYPNAKINYRLEKDEEMWDNQDEAFEEIKKNPVGTVSSATGTGKTRIIEETINHRGLKTLVVVPYRLIQNQMYKKFADDFGRKNVSIKMPKKGEALDVKDTITYKKIGGNVSDLYEKSETKTNGRKLGSSYSVDVDETKPKMKLGSSYSKEFFDSDLSNEEKYLKDKKHEKKFVDFKEKQKLKQFSKKIKKKVPKGSNITIVCFNSLPEASQEFLDSIECVIIDECHHSSAITIREALDRMPNAAYRYGFSATPWRDKNADHKLLLSALGDKIIYDLGGKEAVDRGIIAKPKYQVITSPTPDLFLQEDRNWRNIVEKGLIGNKTRNTSIINKAVDLFENDHNVLICVDEIAHLEILASRFKQRGIDVLTIHGEQNHKLNDENIKKISASTKGLISIGTMAVGEGTDMPNISAIILASGGKASIRFLQRIGRGTRLTNGKNEVIVVDFEDWFNPVLLKHFRERKRIFYKYFGDK